MAVPATNITLASVAAEFGGVAQHSISEYYSGLLYVPLGSSYSTPWYSGGQLSFQGFASAVIPNNYVTVGSYTQIDKYSQETNYYGWLSTGTPFGSINSNSVYMYSTTTPKFGTVPVSNQWRAAYHTNGPSGTLYRVLVHADWRTSYPTYIRIGVENILVSSFTRTYASPITTLTKSHSNNSFLAAGVGNRVRVSAWYTAYGEPPG